jgi:hypothetical protein
VRSIKGNNPGKTEKTKSLSPSIVPEVYFVGFMIIKMIIKKINNVEKVSKK